MNQEIMKETMRQAALKHVNEVMAPYDTIMEQGGFDAICAFTEQLGGLTIYVPSARTIFGRCLEIEAQKEYDGKNLIALAKKYGYTERHMRRMVGMQ